MDLDAYVSAHRATWERLDALSRRRRLTGAEADEMIDTYQRVATHLSVIRSTAPDASLVAYLSGSWPAPAVAQPEPGSARRRR